MSVQTIYVPYTAGTVIGSYTRLPWIAESAAHAVAAGLPGQPVFTDRAETFVWIDQARSGALRLLDFAVARVAADTIASADGPRRAIVDGAAVLDPHRQVVRADATSRGPSVSVLNALYQGVHEHAHDRWHSRPGAGTVADPATDLIHLVWHRTYPIAFHDAQQVLTDRIGHAAKLVLSEPRLALDPVSVAVMSAVTAPPATPDGPPLIPAPAPALVADAAGIVGDERAGGWRHAVDQIWAAALVTAAVDGLITAATALTSTVITPAGIGSATGRAVTGWLRRALADTHRSILREWLPVAGHRPPPAAARAYPAIASTVDAATVDATTVLPAPPAAVAALPAGRVR